MLPNYPIFFFVLFVLLFSCNHKNERLRTTINEPTLLEVQTLQTLNEYWNKKGLEVDTLLNLSVDSIHTIQDSAILLTNLLDKRLAVKLEELKRVIQMDKERIQYYEDNFESPKIIASATKKFREYIVLLNKEIEKLKRKDYATYKDINQLYSRLRAYQIDTSITLVHFVKATYQLQNDSNLITQALAIRPDFN